MIPDDSTGFRARYAAISARLDAGRVDAAGLDALKQDIIALYKAIEQRVNELTLLKEEVKGLVAKWKEVQQGAAPTVAPPMATEQPVVRADALGASTFIDKGWNRISLGDY